MIAQNILHQVDCYLNIIIQGKSVTTKHQNYIIFGYEQAAFENQVT
jgi:hypothetical protein